jgi:hypothetical protein
MAGKTPDRRRYSHQLPDGSFGASIEMDAEDIEECRWAAFLLYTTILGVHGRGMANEIFSQQVMTKRQIKKQKNYRLRKIALRFLKDPQSQSVEKVAARLVEINKSRPPEVRYGPTGTTSVATMAKQIGRLLKANDPDISF